MFFYTCAYTSQGFWDFMADNISDITSSVSLNCTNPYVTDWVINNLSGEVKGEYDIILAPGTKEDSPDLNALYIPDDDLAAKLAEVEDKAPRYHAIKQGRIAPIPCGKCAYCRATKKLTGIIDYKSLE